MPHRLIPTLSQHGAQPLDAHQRKFNRLLGQLDKARAELAGWQTEASRFATAYDQLVRPQMMELRGHRAEAARCMDALLGQQGWTRAEQQLLRELVCETAACLVDDAGLGDDEQAAFKVLHDKHADVDFDTENREALAGMKGLFEAVTGLDLGDAEAASEEDIIRRAHERMRQQAEEQGRSQASEGEDAASARRSRKPGKAAAAKALREQEAAQVASQNLREVYRKLAGALHPDRAADEADRATRTERMQRANQAYEVGNLLGLLALQLEIEQVDAAHVARITSERAAQLSRLLAEQLAELKSERMALHVAFCHGYGLDPMHQMLSAKKLGRLLQDEVAQMHAALATARQDLRHLRGERADTKRWLKQIRRYRGEEDRMDALMGGFPF
jgi:hypothetical protein